MIGTTYKLGFDGTSVKKGLAGLGGMMKKFASQVGIGATRQVGVKMTDWVGRLISVIPEAASEMLDWSGSMVDLSEATGIATKDLILFSQAIAEAGFEGDSTKVLMTFTKAIQDAKGGSEELNQALRAAGITSSDLFSDDTMTLIQKVGQGLQGLAAGPRGKIMEALFGGKGGTRLMAAFNNLPAAMKDVEKGIGGMVNKLDPMLQDADKFGDMLSRFQYLKMSLIGSVLQGAGFTNLTNMTDQLISMGQMLQPIAEKIGQSIKPMLEFLNQVITDINNNGFQKVFGEAMQGIWKSIGKSIGDGFKESFSIGDAFKSMISVGGSKSTTFTDPRLIQETVEQTDLLQRIYAKNPTALFA